jgi:hypothetical protein
MPPAKRVLIAVESFACEVDGVPWMVQAGVTRVRPDHPLVKGREELFIPDVPPDVEEH